VARVPATTGLPIITLGSETIVGSLIIALLAVTLADSSCRLRGITPMEQVERTC